MQKDLYPGAAREPERGVRRKLSVSEYVDEVERLLARRRPQPAQSRLRQTPQRDFSTLT